MQYGLIGASLKHSFSKEIHSFMGDYAYELCELATKEDFDAFMTKRDFKGINVTIPYKQDVIPYCDELSQEARKIGAVNTIVNKNGKLIGYNTDFYGFEMLAQNINVDFKDKIVMLLGTGGTQKTASAVAAAHSAKEQILVSRRKSDNAITYEEALQRTDTQIIINTSPVGMYPNNNALPIDLSAFPNLQAVLDVVYNPLETNLVAMARKLGINSSNGLLMLSAQAKAAAELFCDTSIDDSCITKAQRTLKKRLCNIVLIGMPSCGKSTIGKKLAIQLNKTFIDTDALIEKAAAKSIKDIFAQDDEQVFRKLEAEIIEKASAKTNCVISTGGGCILNGNNIKALRQNGIIIYIKRPLSFLDIGGARPLSSSEEALAKLYEQRAPLYSEAADLSIDNTKSIEDVIINIKENIDEALNN
ncbi:MAG: shikimate kinase [Oscillospiraceae bacterium]